MKVPGILPYNRTMQCPKCSTKLTPIPHREGSIVDGCPSCGGVWLDRGEIFLFSRKPRILARALDEHFPKTGPSERSCPRCQRTSMAEHEFLGGGPTVDSCGTCRGIWFDQKELAEARRLDAKIFAMNQAQLPAGESLGRPTRSISPTMRLPNLLLRSVALVATLYGALGLILISLAEFGLLSTQIVLPLFIGFALLQFLISPFIMDWTQKWFYRVHWLAPNQLPPFLADYLAKACQQLNMRVAKFGIIPDGAPNAYTYGHTPKNMRIVISQGILDTLDQDEVRAVVAHELGHGKNWDMALMTIVQIVPMVAYHIYRSLMNAKSSSNDKSASARVIIALCAYLLYFVSQYLVLWFSRVREYHADRFSAQLTRQPEKLGSALVKIAYGLSGQQPSQDKDSNKEFDSIGALGIFNREHAQSLAMLAPQKLGIHDIEQVKSTMQWDLWNPWALYYEIHSTHPLVAKRLLALSDYGEATGQGRFLTFDRRKPESYWDEFLIDPIFSYLPFLGFLMGLGWVFRFSLPNIDQFNSLLVWENLGKIVLCVGVSEFIKLLFTYSSRHFSGMSIAALLRRVKVSHVRPIPVTLEGEIIGKGVPGLVWSEDFVMRDQTGIIFLDYRQPLRTWEFLFGLLRAGDFQGENVIVQGWYRRSPVPYVEIYRLRTGDSIQKSRVMPLRYVTAILMIAIGFFLAIRDL